MIKFFLNIAPGAYSPEKCNLEHQPAFSFGGRYDTEKPYKTPGNDIKIESISVEFK